jgi:hypothetical protein
VRVDLDPVAKFHRVTGAAASLLVELEELGQRRIRKMAARASGRGQHRDELAGPLDELRRQVAELEVAERGLLDRYQREAQRETELRLELVRRGLLR